MESQTKPPKISLDEFKNIVRMLPEVREGITELPVLAKKMGQEKLARMFDADCLWSELYTLSFEEFLAVFIYRKARGGQVLPFA